MWRRARSAIDAGEAPGLQLRSAVGSADNANCADRVMEEQGRIQENSKGRVMNRSGAPTYTQN